MSITVDRPQELAASVEVVDLVTAVGSVSGAGVPIDDERLRADLTALLPLRAQVEAIVAERLAAFDARGLCKDDGAGSTTSWAAARCNISGAEISGVLATGKRMKRFSALAELLKAGAVSARHVRHVERALAGLPERLVEPAIGFLTPLAATHDPAAFAVICQRMRETLTPELTDAETKDLEADQWLDVSAFDGGLKIDGMLRGINAEAFAAAMRRFGVIKPEDTRTAKQRRADAAGELARVAANAPVAGLAPVHVTVICDLVTLQRALDAAAGRPMSFSGRMPAAEADLVHGAHGELTRAPIDWAALLGAVLNGETRRLVLGPGSEVLDLGRAHRFFTRTQRIAIRRGEQRCRVRGCRSPYVEYDHKIGWGEGGPTNVANGRPFCGFHNRLRTQGWDTEDLPNGEVTLIRPLDWYLRKKKKQRPRIH
jgi:hypothetical protein